MRFDVSDESSEHYRQTSAEVREALDAARDTHESIRATRRRVRLQGLIISWRGRRPKDPAVTQERLALILDAVRDEADAPMGNIQLMEHGLLRIRAAVGFDDTFLAHFATVQPGKCSCGAALRNGGATVVNDVEASPLYNESDRAMLLDSGVQACQSLALKRGGEALGVISLHYRSSDIPRRRQAAFSGLANEIAEAVALALM